MSTPQARRVQKLHLVGYTTDHHGLILSARRGARSGGYVLNVDASVAEAVDAYRAKLEEQSAQRNGRPDREESRLPISEIQARLRRGKSIKDIAKDAGVSPEWVERFAAPVFAERAQVIDYVRNAALRRPRLGTSSHRIGDAIRTNLADRGVAISPVEFAEGWTSQQLPNGKWTVRFKVRYRGADKTLRFDLTGVGADIVAHDQLTQQLSYVAPPVRKPAAPAKVAPAPAEDDTKKRAQVSTGFRPDPVVKPTSRPAKERERAAREMTKAAARRASEAEKGAARKARERAQALAKREREARAEAQRREKEALARTKAAAAAARAAAVEAAKRERAEAAAAAARKAEREQQREAARQKAVKAVQARRPAPKKAAPATAAAKKRTAAEVRKRGAAAEEAARTRAAKPRTPTAATEAKRAAAERTATPKAAPVKATPVKATPAKAATRPTTKATPKAPARKAPARVAEPRPTAAARVDPARLAGAGGATDAYGPEGARALFRAGLAEPAAEVEVDTTAEVARPVAEEERRRPEVRLMGRRRRRQLRAD